MYVLYEETVEIVTNPDKVFKVQPAQNDDSFINKFSTKPQGIIVTDTYNHFAFPIKPTPKIDTHKVDLIEVTKRFKSDYSTFGESILPWHFTVELIEHDYYIFNTRPIDLKFPLMNNDFPDNKFLKNLNIDISDCIHIAVIGDSNIDIYNKKIYEIISRNCISPFFRYFKIPGGYVQRTFFINMGKRFNEDLIVKYIRK